MSSQPDKKAALITGGSRGIGRAISQRLASDGYQVIINYRSNKEQAEAARQQITEQGGCAETVAFDVRDASSSKQAVEEILKRYGSLEVLVNNAGIASDQLLVMMGAEKWDEVIDTTLKGFYNVTKPVLQSMLVRRRGSIVSLASMAALTGNRGQSNYAAAKAGLIGASKSLAQEVAKRGIRVNVIAPGLIDTEMIASAPVKSLLSSIPMGRIGKPEEVAGVVSFLCSDDASYITGQVISVNGGMIG